MWSCATCTLKNPARKRRCDACGVRRAVDAAVVVATEGGAAAEPPAAPNQAAERTDQRDSSSLASRSNCRSKKRSTSSVKGWLRTKRRRRSQQHGSENDDDDDADHDGSFSFLHPPLVAFLDERNFTVHLKMIPSNSAAASSESSAQLSAQPGNALVAVEQNPADRMPTIPDKDAALLVESGAEHLTSLQTSAMDDDAGESTSKRQRLQAVRSDDKIEDSTATTATSSTDNTPTNKYSCTKTLGEQADGGSESQLKINTDNLHSLKRLKKAVPSATNTIGHGGAPVPQAQPNGAPLKNGRATQRECPLNPEVATSQQRSFVKQHDERTSTADRTALLDQSTCSDHSTSKSTVNTLVDLVVTATAANAPTINEKSERCTEEGEVSTEPDVKSDRAEVAAAEKPKGSPCSFQNSSDCAVENSQQRGMLPAYASKTLVVKLSPAPATKDYVVGETLQKDLDDDDDDAVEANQSPVLPPQETSSADLVGIVAPPTRSNDETKRPVNDENGMKENERCDENGPVSSDDSISDALKKEESCIHLKICDGADLDSLCTGRSENGSHGVNFSAEQPATAPKSNPDPGAGSLVTSGEGPPSVAANNFGSWRIDASSKSQRRESGGLSSTKESRSSLNKISLRDQTGKSDSRHGGICESAPPADSLEEQSGGCDEQTAGDSKRIHTDRDESFASGFFYTPTTQSQDSQTESSEVPKPRVRSKDSSSQNPLGISIPAPLRTLNAPADPQLSSPEKHLFASNQMFRSRAGGNVSLAATTSVCHPAAAASLSSLTHRRQQVDRSPTPDQAASISATSQTATSGTLQQTRPTATAASKIPLQSEDELGLEAKLEPPCTALSALKASSFLRGDSYPDGVDSVGPVTFQTAGLGHKISVSDQCLANASKLLHGSNMCEPIVSATLDREPTSSVAPASFRTAGQGLTVTVSEEALRKGKKLFCQNECADSDGCVRTLKQARAFIEKKPERQSPTLHTAGRGFIVGVSDDVLARGAKLLEKGPRESQPTFESTSVAFATAGLGQRIAFSSKSLQRARKLLTNKGSREGENASESTFASSTGDVSFTSARNESQQAINPRHSPFTRKCGSMSGLQPVHPGFQTAGIGNLVSVTASSLSKAANLLRCPVDEKRSSENAPALLFQTAGVGKTISVSDASLTKANALLCSDNTNSDSHPVPAPYAHHPMEGSFSAPDVGEVDNLFKPKPMANREQFSSLSSGTGTERVSRAMYTARHGRKIALSATCFADAERFRNETEEVQVNPAQKTLNNKPESSHVADLRKRGFASMSRPTEEEYVANDSSDTKNSESNQSPLASSTTQVSFQTAGLGKIVSVSAARLAEANKLLNNVEDEPPSSATLTTTHAAPDGFQAFRHEQNHHYHSPTSNTERAQRFGEEDSEECLQFSNQLSVSFQTGLGNKILVPASSIAEAEKFLNGSEDINQNQRQNEERCENANCRPDFASFETAGLGVSISVSQSSLARAEKLLYEDAGLGNLDPAQVACHATVEESHDGQSSRVIGNSPDNSKESLTFAITGTGSKVSVSAATMENAQENQRVSLCGVAPVASFQTAGTGSKVSISDTSIENARKILREPSSRATPAISFRTAGAGKTVSISDTSIENARNILRDPSSAANSAVSFHTAGAGKKVSISDASLENAQKIFRDSSSGATPAVSFLTASAGGKVSISDAGIETAQKQLHHSPETAPTCYPQSGTREVTSLRQQNLRVSFGLPELQGSGSVSTTTSESSSTFDERNTASFQHVDARSTTTATPAFAKISQSGPAEHSYVTPGSSVTQVHSTSSACTGVPLPTKTPVFTPHDDRQEYSTDDVAYTLVDGRPPSAVQAVRTSSMLTDYDQCCRHGVPAMILEINSVNAHSVLFDPESLLPIGFDAEPDAMKVRYLGYPEDYRKSLVELGCDSEMISDKWISNHTRWIVWKTASIERKFAHQNLGGKRLTYNRVVEALLHRYQKEIKGGARPAVRRILNRDVSSNSMMILCVARIRRENSTDEQKARIELDDGKKEIFVVELTDGWYSLPATLDGALCGFVGNGRIRVGTKLLVSSSVLTGFEEGTDPLDDTFDPFKSSCSPVLQLSANSTRIAAWNAKMGFVRPTARIAKQDGLLLVRKVSDIIAGGGRVPLIHLTVMKRHPLKYLERAPDGGRARILTGKEESKRIEYEEKQQQCLVERFSEDVHAECAKVRIPIHSTIIRQSSIACCIRLTLACVFFW